MRVLGSISVLNGKVVQTIRYGETVRPLGRPELIARFLDSWGADEIVLTSIDSSFDVSVIKSVASQISTPLCYGGGLRTVSDMVSAIRAGADRVSVNTLLRENPGLIRQAASELGSQCLIASIDVKAGEDASDLVKLAEENKVGEILVRSKTNDGTRSGLDTVLAKSVVGSTNLPVLVAGGVGSQEHVKDLQKQVPDVAGVVIGNLFAHREHSVQLLKSCLQGARKESQVNYDLHKVGSELKLLKPDEDYLSGIAFRYFEDEVI